MNKVICEPRERYFMLCGSYVTKGEKAKSFTRSTFVNVHYNMPL